MVCMLMRIDVYVSNSILSLFLFLFLHLDFKLSIQRKYFFKVLFYIFIFIVSFYTLLYFFVSFTYNAKFIYYILWVSRYLITLYFVLEYKFAKRKKEKKQEEETDKRYFFFYLMHLCRVGFKGWFSTRLVVDDDDVAMDDGHTPLHHGFSSRKQ